MTTVITNKINALVTQVFGGEIENIDEIWLNNAEVQKQLKSFCASKKGKDKKKDPNAPKRGKSSYLYFCADNRSKVKGILGDESKATDVTKELGVRWNALKDSTRKSDKECAGQVQGIGRH